MDPRTETALAPILEWFGVRASAFLRVKVAKEGRREDGRDASSHRRPVPPRKYQVVESTRRWKKTSLEPSWKPMKASALTWAVCWFRPLSTS